MPKFRRCQICRKKANKFFFWLVLLSPEFLVIVWLETSYLWDEPKEELMKTIKDKFCKKVEKINKRKQKNEKEKV